MFANFRLYILSLCLLMASCASVQVGVPADSVNYDSNPAPDAIVGVWSRTMNFSGYHSIVTKLFSADGTGFIRSKMQGFDADIQQDVNGKNFALTWHYAGDGWWDVNVESAGGYPNQDARYRVASDSQGGMTLYWIDEGIAKQYSKVSDM